MEIYYVLLVHAGYMKETNANFKLFKEIITEYIF